MNEQIIQMAREAGFYQDQPMYYDESMLKTFAKLVAEHEREACAQICLSVASNPPSMITKSSLRCCEAIRARGQI